MFEMNQAPWMIEVAYEYSKAARLTYNNKLLNSSQILAALSIEILFKSFFAEEGKVTEGIGKTHRFCKGRSGIKGHGHDLSQLYSIIPNEIVEKLELKKHRDDIADFFHEHFIKARYPYENGAIGSYSDVIIEIAEEMIRNTILYYRELGSDDPFITSVEI